MSLIAFMNDKFVPVPLGVPTQWQVVMTDASGTGWGICLPYNRLAGAFHSSIIHLNIAVKELLVIFWALLILDQDGVNVQINTDSLVSVNVLKKGHSLNPHLDGLSSVIWRLAARRSLNLRLKFLRGSFNVIADQLSRDTVISTEWSISHTDFLRILEKAGFTPQVDLFATSLNNKTPVYLSPCPDPQAHAIDSMSVSWNTWDLLYLFPPTPMISKALAKLRCTNFKKALLVCLDLEGRPWFKSLLLLRHTSSFKLSLHLQQEVNGRLMIQDSPTRLVVFTILKDTI